MKKVLITASLLCFLLPAGAQFAYDYLKAAGDYFRKADYYSAALYYEKYLNPQGADTAGRYDPYVVRPLSGKQKMAAANREQAVYNLAESYRQLHYYVKAEPYYRQAAAFSPSRFPLATFHYATTLRALERFDEAETMFHRFLTEYTTLDKYTEAANTEIRNLYRLITELNTKAVERFTVSRPAAVASEGANYAPFFVSPATMYFTSTRPEEKSSGKEYINRIYAAYRSDTGYGAPVKVNIAQPPGVHQGGISVTPDGNTMYLTRWTTGKGKKTAASIYVSQRSGNAWSDPQPLKGLADTGTSNKQPYVLPDGRVVFASDREGGLGGYDLWTAEIDLEGNAGFFSNLGPSINTPFDEEAPFYHVPSHTLVFSSNGREGLGGYDLYFIKNNNGTWGAPENFGYPVNSVKNDIYFASGGPARNILENVVISSDRATECCYQLFSLSRARLPKGIGGTVLDCKTKTPLAGVQLRIRGGADTAVFAGTTAQGGAYSFTLENFQPLQVTATLPGYTTKHMAVPVPADTAAESATIPVLCMEKVPVVGEVVVVHDIHYAVSKATVLDKSKPALDNLVRMMKEHPNMTIEISGHTDNIGSERFNRMLSQARAQNVVNYLVRQGIEKSRLTAKGYGASRPVAPNKKPNGADNPEGREKNRRTEFKVLRNE